MGHYMLADQPSGIFSSAFFELKQVLKPCSSRCEIEFFYFLSGTGDNDRLRILLTNAFNAYDYTTLSIITGDTSYQWKRFILRLGRIYKPFLFEFASSLNKGPNFKTIAIDDIKLRSCQFPAIQPNGCSNEQFTCNRKACIPKFEMSFSIST